MKKNIFKKALSYLENLPEYLVYLGAGVLLIDEAAKGIFGNYIIVSEEYKWTILTSLVAIFAIAVIKRLEELKSYNETKSSQLAGVIEITESHTPIDVVDLINKSYQIDLLTLSGTKIFPLGDDRVIAALNSQRKNTKIRILLANPYSEAIKWRYQNDEPDSYETGLEGINRRLIKLYKWLEKVDQEKRIEIRVFSNYPTVSILKADSDYYSTIYGFKLRGGDCPKVHSKANGAYADFLKANFEKTYKASMPLSEWYNQHNRTK